MDSEWDYSVFVRGQTIPDEGLLSNSLLGITSPSAGRRPFFIYL